MAGAEDVGKRLLREVEECGLDELLQALHVHNEKEARETFNFPHLDRQLSITEQGTKDIDHLPNIEIMSLAPGGGKTQLLYHLIALAVLPRISGGKGECVVCIDTDGKFSVSRLAGQIRLALQRGLSADCAETIDEATVTSGIGSALKHVHIFRPQSLASTIATLDDLPNYLFNHDRHYSIDREVAFIALDSASAFYWQDRSETENAAFLAKTGTSNELNQTSTYFSLAASLKRCSKTLNCPAIFTTWYLGPQQKQGSGLASKSFRPQIPPLQADLRLAVQRLPVRKVPSGLSLEAVMREAPDRQKAVAEGRFECFVNEWSLPESLIQRLGDNTFSFRILHDALLMDDRATDNE